MDPVLLAEAEKADDDFAGIAAAERVVWVQTCDFSPGLLESRVPVSYASTYHGSPPLYNTVMNSAPVRRLGSILRLYNTIFRPGNTFEHSESPTPIASAPNYIDSSPRYSRAQSYLAVAVPWLPVTVLKV